KSVSQWMPRVSRISSLRWSRPPIAIRARRQASSEVSPSAIPSSTLRSRWNRSSSSSSLSTWRRRKIDRTRSGAVNHQCSSFTVLRLRERDDLGDRGRQPLPVRRLGLELLPAQPREGVELRFPVVLGRLPLRLDPAFLLELVERRIERALADLEHVAGHGPQPQADRPAVQRLERQDLQQEKIESSLDQIARLAHLGFLG